MTHPLRAKRPRQNVQVMDPRTLGRPVHLLPKFVAPLREGLAERIRSDLNRRYAAQFELGAMAMQRLAAEAGDCRWHYAGLPAGTAGFALDRGLLLAILDYRYGAPAQAETEAAPTTGWPPETTTEERLGSMLATRFLELLGAFLPQPAAAETAGAMPAPQPGRAPRKGTWVIRAEITETSINRHGNLWFSLDDECIRLILAGLAPTQAPRRSPRTVTTLGADLQLGVVATLYERQIPLGTVLDLKIGEVLPISLGNASVRIGDSPLFSARVAESKGKLCLTSFEDLE